MSKRTTSGGMRIGAEPRAYLMPREVLDRQRSRRIQSAMNVGVVIVLLVVVAATGGAAYLAISSQNDLADARDKTTELIAQQAQFSDIRDLRDEVVTAKSARQVAAADEVNWPDYIAFIDSTLPEGVTISNVQTESGSPSAPFQQNDTPLSRPSIAAVTLSVTGSDLQTIRGWLDDLTTVPGYADAAVSSVDDGDEQTYDVSLSVDLNQIALSQRFAGEGLDLNADDDDADDADEADADDADDADDDAQTDALGGF